MTTDRKVVDAIKAMRGNVSSDQILIASINTVSPVTIKMYDQIIKKHIYMDDIKKETLKKGDTVVVLNRGISFYILERLVKVA